VISLVQSVKLRAGRASALTLLHGPDQFGRYERPTMADEQGNTPTPGASKTCTKCGETKPLDAFTPSKRASQGVANWCRLCYNAYGAAYYAKTKERRRARARDIRARMPAEKRVAKGRVWREANPDYFREHYAANRERVSSRVRRHAAANRERVAAKARRYYEEHPDVGRAGGARRYARKMSAPGRGVSAAEWRDVLDASLGLCAYCGERKALTLDHIDPLSRGGAHDPENLVAACRNCNSSKRQSPLLVWLVRRTLDRSVA
jgi:5-methylcytosine-specific restriction endonuclease McrA